MNEMYFNAVKDIYVVCMYVYFPLGQHHSDIIDRVHIIETASRNARTGGRSLYFKIRIFI